MNVNEDLEFWRRKEIKKQTSHLQIIQKFAECVKAGCVNSDVGV